MNSLDHLLLRQEGVITRRQALLHLSESALGFRLGRRWSVILPGVYVAQTGPLSEQQRLRAALLFAGEQAQLDDLSALRRYRARYLPDDSRVFTLVPAHTQRKSRDFVVIRRTIYLPRPCLSPGAIPLVPEARALADFALRYDDERTVRAVLAAAVQRRRVSLDALLRELEHAPARGRPRFTRVLEELGAGVRSAPEGDVRTLVDTSAILPKPLYNCLLELPGGRRISPDLLIEEAALIHETNGREPHEDEDPFDSMQERHDVLTVVGFTVLHNSPRLIKRDSQRVLTDIEQCYLRDKGRGLPPGVRIIRRAAA